METTTITSSKLTEIQQDVLASLADVEQKHGIKISIGRGTYSNSSEGDFKLKLLAINPDETDEDRYRNNLERAIKMGVTSFTLEDIGTVFKKSPRGRNRYTFLGLDTNFKPVAQERGKVDISIFTGSLTRDLMLHLKA